MKKVLIILSVLGLILSACGGGKEAAPAISAEQVEQTALADARTMVANTQAAMPTATFVPTDTPAPTIAPTDTLVPLPTIEQPTLPQPTAEVFTPPPPPPPTPTKSTGTGGCYPMTEWDVESITVNMNNQAKGVVTLSLNGTLATGECGSFSRQFEKSHSLVAPVACYWIWAWVDGPKDFTLSTTYCMDVPRSYNITITNDAIKIK